MTNCVYSVTKNLIDYSKKILEEDPTYEYLFDNEHHIEKILDSIKVNERKYFCLEKSKELKGMSEGIKYKYEFMSLMTINDDNIFSAGNLDGFYEENGNDPIVYEQLKLELEQIRNDKTFVFF